MTAGSGLPIPNAMLTYHYWGEGPTGDGLMGEGPPLFQVHEVTARLADGRVRMIAQGPMRKRDGQRGAHSRCFTIDLDDERQPPWVYALTRDAVARLNVRFPTAGDRETARAEVAAGLRTIKSYEGDTDG